ALGRRSRHAAPMPRLRVPLRLMLSLVFLPLVAAGMPLGYYLPENTAYDPAVPTPEQFLGHQVGEWHVRSELATAYVRAVAAAAPGRVKYEQIGRTHEGKPLIALTITSPVNHQ